MVRRRLAERFSGIYFTRPVAATRSQSKCRTECGKISGEWRHSPRMIDSLVSRIRQRLRSPWSTCGSTTRTRHESFTDVVSPGNQKTVSCQGSIADASSDYPRSRRLLSSCYSMRVSALRCIQDRGSCQDRERPMQLFRGEQGLQSYSPGYFGGGRGLPDSS